MPSNDEKIIEQEIQAKGLNALRVTLSSIDALVDRIVYSYDVQPLGSTTTMAHAFLDGEFYLGTGTSTCVSKENFDKEIGMQIAQKNAEILSRKKLWEIEGYLPRAFMCL
jgi:hypothetical protein